MNQLCGVALLSPMKVYEVTKLDHEYKDLSGYRNPTAEYDSAPHHKCPAKNSLESDDTYI